MFLPDHAEADKRQRMPSDGEKPRPPAPQMRPTPKPNIRPHGESEFI